MITAWILASLLAAPPAPQRTAVMALQVKSGEDLDRPAALITDLLTTEVSKHPQLAVIGPSDIHNALSLEQQRQALNCAAESCLAEVAGALGVELMVSGSLGRVGNALVINLTLMEVPGMKVRSRVSEVVPGGVENLLPLLPHLVGTLVHGVPGAPPVPARPGAVTAAPEPAPRPAGPASTLPRRLAGLGVAGGGGALLLGAGLLGLGSLGYFLVSHVVAPDTPLGQAPLRYSGFGLAGLADVLGLLGAAVLLTGLVVAAWP